jgi:hypothetical protein
LPLIRSPATERLRRLEERGFLTLPKDPPGHRGDYGSGDGEGRIVEIHW